MFAALAHRVVVLPSTAFGAAQQEPLDDAVTGLLRDSNCSAAGAPPGAARAIAPPSTEGLMEWIDKAMAERAAQSGAPER